MKRPREMEINLDLRNDMHYMLSCVLQFHAGGVFAKRLEFRPLLLFAHSLAGKQAAG